jgi:outer membrane protein TolC
VVRPSSAIIQTGATTPADTDSAFPSMAELSEDALIEQVLRRNPTIAQMAAAAQAAATRYPQVISLNDPQFGAIVGPSSIASSNVDAAYRLEISQAFPFPGKLELRGEAALNEAAAAAAELNDTRLQLVEAARNALADYYLAARAVEVNEEGLKLLREFRDNANARYKTGQGEQQDVLQADVAIARQQERASTLERLRKVAQARINTLLNRSPDQVLPPPPKEFASPAALPGASELRDLAIGQRPAIAALRSRLAADETAVALANKEYYPDFEAMAAYDAFWQPRERDLRPMIGVRLNLPIQIARRNAAVAEAEAKLAQRRAALARFIAQVGFQVQEAHEQVRETERSLNLYQETAIPKANENVRLARTAYANNKVPFFNLIEAQRNLVELREREFELRAEAIRRRAALDRAVGAGHMPSPPAAPETLPPVQLPFPISK